MVNSFNLYSVVIDSVNIIYGVFVVAVTFLLNLKYFVLFFSNKKIIKIKSLNNVLNSDYVKGHTRTHLENELETEYFKLYSGLRIEKSVREELIKVLDSTNGELSFLNFKNALPNILYKEGKLDIKITLFDKIYYFFHLLGGLFLAFFGVFLVFTPAIITSTNLKSLLFYFLTGVFFMIAAGFMVKQTSSVYSAKLVRPYLLRYNYDKELQLKGESTVN